jgi:hypothetical protein
VQVGRDTAGDSVAVWGDATGGPLQARVRPVERPWSAVAVLSGRDASAPQVAVTPSGRAVAVWQGYDAQNDQVVAASTLAGPLARWSRARQLSLRGQGAVAPAVALDARGGGAVAWSTDAEGGAIEVAGRSRGGGWRAPRRLSPAGELAGAPAVAVDRGGGTAVVWRAVRGGRVTIQVVVGNAEQNRWGRVVTVRAGRPGEDLGAPRVGLDARGDALAIWYHRDPAGYRIEGAERRDHGAWFAIRPLSSPAGRPHDLARPGPTFNVPALALSPEGAAVAAWVEVRGGTDVVRARVRAPGGGWSAAPVLSAPGEDAGEPQVAMAPDGRAVAVWEELDGEAFRVEAVALDPGRGWSRTRAISVSTADAQRPVVALDRDGRAVVGWVDTSRGAVVSADLAGPARESAP